MKTGTILLILAISALGLMTAPTHVQAASRTWVSGASGATDANPCTRSAPCATFAHAYGATDAFGEINCIDAGNFGIMVISKSITVSCEGATAGIFEGNDGIEITGTAATDAVYLKGLDIEGLGPSFFANTGIAFFGAGALHVEKCRIHGFVNTSQNLGYGIVFEPNGTASLFVSDTAIADNGSFSGFGGGILMQPSASANVNVSLDHVQMTNNTFGFKADGSNAGTIEVSVTNSLASGNRLDGFYALTTGGRTNVVISHSVSSNNGDTGIHANGSNVQLLFADTVVSGNGLGVKGVNGATLLSYQTSPIDTNTSNNTPVPAQNLH
jgi:hypothetical protein